MTIVPSRMEVVAQVAAVSAIQGSTQSTGPSSKANRWSQRKKPFQPAPLGGGRPVGHHSGVHARAEAGQGHPEPHAVTLGEAR